MSKFGLPYMGSKQSFAELICKFLPSNDNFYDLFGGGFSITDCMLQNHNTKYKRFFFNEIEADIVELIKDAIAGKYNYDVFKPEWIDRERFFKDKDKSAYIRVVWSFGNNQKGYMFGEDIELQKKALHNAVVFNEFNPLAEKILKLKKFPENLNIKSRRLLCRRIISARASREGELQQLERLERLEQLERLQQLERLERLELSSKSYDEIQTLPNSTIYCDPPYIGTATYRVKFDHEKFYKWARDQSNPVFISEYKMPEDFDVALSLDNKKSLSGGASTDSIEKLFVNKAAKKLLNDKGIKTFPNKHWV